LKLLQSSSLGGRLPLERTPKRVLFVGKNMSRSRCTGGLVDAITRHGLAVRWVNIATLRRWLGAERAIGWARRIWQRFAPDIVFVFCRDLPQELLEEFRVACPIVVWVEEPLQDLDPGFARYLALTDLVCLSNPTRAPWLADHGVRNMVFLMSGFSPRFHYPLAPRTAHREVVFVGGPGAGGQRAPLLAEVARHYELEIRGPGWEPYRQRYPHLRIGRPIDNAGFRRICATSRIVLGMNQVNSDYLYFSNRTFLTLACRAFHLTHYVPGLENVFVNGRHLAWYRDTDECLAQIHRYLADPAARGQIAAEGHALVMARHQYFHRFSGILETLATGLTRHFDTPMVLPAEPSRATAVLPHP
jgi:hypothetical protein